MPEKKLWVLENVQPWKNWLMSDAFGKRPFLHIVILKISLEIIATSFHDAILTMEDAVIMYIFNVLLEECDFLNHVYKNRLSKHAKWLRLLKYNPCPQDFLLSQPCLRENRKPVWCLSWHPLSFGMFNIL